MSREEHCTLYGVQRWIEMAPPVRHRGIPLLLWYPTSFNLIWSLANLKQFAASFLICQYRAWKLRNDFSAKKIKQCPFESMMKDDIIHNFAAGQWSYSLQCAFEKFSSHKCTVFHSLFPSTFPLTIRCICSDELLMPSNNIQLAYQLLSFFTFFITMRPL